jgi:hypothetical protein
MDTPAFPCERKLTDQDVLVCEGMSLRDYFAAKAIAASYPKLYEMFLDNIFDDWHGDGVESLAKEAYVIADAMMEVRKL